MKYYSEKLNKLFDTEKALKDAETAAANEAAKQELSKKTLSQKIEAAEEAVDAAYKNYEDTRNLAAKILEDSNKQIIDIMNKAKAQITDAEKARTDAIVAFNQQFGTYRANYTGERAKREAKRIDSLASNILSGFMFPHWNI